jgi:signal peptidase
MEFEPKRAAASPKQGRGSGRNFLCDLGRTLLLALISLTLGVNVYLWNAKRLVGNALPTPFGYGVSVVLSGSMEPTLSVHDLVLIRETPAVKAGDVVVYQSENELIIHRVISVGEDTLITQGDANSSADEPISHGAVKGVLVASVPHVGILVLALKNPVVVILLLAAAFLLMELSYRKEKRSDDRELEEIKAEIHRLQREQYDT